MFRQTDANGAEVGPRSRNKFDCLPQSLMSTTTFTSGEMSSTSSSSPVATTDSQSQNHSSLFSQGGSPGLILAFLAIGLFCGGVIVMFGMRRMSRGPRWIRSRGAQNWEDTDDVQSLHFGRDGLQRNEPMKIPELWELHKEDAKLMNWKDITVSCPLQIISLIGK